MSANQTSTNQEEDAEIIRLCQRFLNRLVDIGALDRTLGSMPLSVLSEAELPTYDGVTYFDGEGAIGIGLRTRDRDGEYKRAFIVGTLLHEMAHVLDGYHHNGKLAHSRSFYNHYSRLMVAAQKAMLFRMPNLKGMKNARDHKALQRFDDLSPFSEVLNRCLLLEEEEEDHRHHASATSKKTAAAAPRAKSPVVRVTLRDADGRENVALVDTTWFDNVTKVFKQKFPKHTGKKTKNRNKGEKNLNRKDGPVVYRVTRTDQDGESQFVLSKHNLPTLVEGDVISCR